MASGGTWNLVETDVGMDRITTVEPVGEEKWVVVRCHSQLTLVLRDELCEAEAPSWVPVFRVHIRRRHARKPSTVVRPLLPGFVFVPQDNVDKAVRLRNSRDVRAFSIFQFNGRVVAIPGVELLPLKEFEEPEPSKRFRQLVKQNRPRIGERVKIALGPFHGLEAVVLASGASYSLVETNQLKIQIATCLLERIQV